MTENSKKKLIIEESSDDKSNPLSSIDTSRQNSNTKSDSSSIPRTSQLNTSSSNPSSQTPSTKSSILLENIDLEKEFKKLNCNEENFFTNECNKFLLKKEVIERNYLSER